ncbi:uncharacterized protein si:ch211-67e16.4 isoform X1 [Acanthopagrus latus]|uniref:uncharacterized protein si:ch211-67e16.4 isoform X1 n=2 Tax=Acanthopagrus latus TaxID=8177 RepID=UPI00187BF411|nr:uncharacterized protein si:ch211-67e16.4 isoform X1 [Acanthopagrus latus]XP_036965235.1 uncharacterized protein si:ch211-67e16.4 isoform X1 [Acanthopagrus latus]
MDVSIAVSLIRGQMGAVVERAVNGAVETVLAEMLKVVGIKFEELKAQVALMKRDLTALQREKALKEKENDNIRAKLRYTELKLKYYRQGVEEELQQRASASTVVRIQPSTFHQAQRGSAGVSSTETSSPCSTQTSTSEGPLTRSNQECTSPQGTIRHTVRVNCHSDAGVASSDTSDLLLPVSLSVDSSTVLFCPTEQDKAQCKDDDQEDDDCEWTISLQPQIEGVDTVEAPSPVQAQTLDPGQQPGAGSLFPEGSPQADSSTLHSSAPQVKQEVEEVICIKEEPEDEQEEANLLLDYQVEQDHLPESEAQSSVTEWSGQRNHTTAFSSAGPSTYAVPQPAAPLLSMVSLPPGIPPRQGVRPWTKDLSLYEEYKLRRNELRRRSLNRRRELEKTLPQPLLADMVRERREKTRLRVARWRAKRKLQACINQAQALGGAAGLSQTGFPISSQHQQHRVHHAATSSAQQRQSSGQSHSNIFLNISAANSISTSLPPIPTTSSSSLLLRGPNMAKNQHTVTSSSSSSYPQVSLSRQSISLTDADVLQ